MQLSQGSESAKHGSLSGVLWQVKDTLGALAERFKALRLEAGGLHISRAAPGCSHALALKRVVQYNPNWVKNQQVRPRSVHDRQWMTDAALRALARSQHATLQGSRFSIFSDCFRSIKESAMTADVCLRILLGPTRGAWARADRVD